MLVTEKDQAIPASSTVSTVRTVQGVQSPDPKVVLETRKRAMQSGSVQDEVLKDLIASQKEIVIFLMNGFQIKAKIQKFDTYCIRIIDHEHRSEIIYKHAISTIAF